MRGPPTHDFSDTLMKQKVADTVLHRYNGEEVANGPKVIEASNQISFLPQFSIDWHVT